MEKHKQIDYVLPRSAWENVVIHENNEPLVLLRETERLKLGLVPKQYDALFFVRETVAEKLYRVSTSLPDGLVLVVIEGYRTMASQQYGWDRKCNKLRAEHPEWTEEEIEQQVRLVVAKPSPLANHHCGGAIDVTIARSNGDLLDMGTPYPSEAMSAEWYLKFKMFPNTFLKRRITKEQENNRKVLRDAMEAEDFVWYPGEWWHYCWGDRMWAVYTGQTTCVYGPVYLEDKP